MPLLPTLEEVERIAYEQIKTSSEEDERWMSFLNNGDDINYYPAQDVANWDFEPETLEFPFLDWSEARIAELQNETALPTTQEIEAWRLSIALERLDYGD